jgi:ABC-type amino acid transport substrate-binding protein
MKKLVLGALVAAFAAAPALAQATTIEFVRDDGTTFVGVFDADGTASINGAAAEGYTWDETTRQLCASSGLCVTFEEAGEGVGFSTRYTTNEGNSGTATITARTE